MGSLAPTHVPSQRPPTPSAEKLRPLGRLASGVIGLLLVGVVVDVVVLFTELRLAGVFDDIAAGEPVVDRDVETLSAVADLANGLALLVLVVTAVVFLVWFSRARSNADVYDSLVHRHASAWAVVGWFIPLLNLFQPKQITDDIWVASDPDRRSLGPTPDDRRSRLVTAWWSACLVGFLGNRLLPNSFESASASSIASSFHFAAAVTTVYIVAAVLLVVLVRRLTTRQEQMNLRFAALEPALAQPPQPGAAPYVAG